MILALEEIIPGSCSFSITEYSEQTLPWISDKADPSHSSSGSAIDLTPSRSGSLRSNQDCYLLFSRLTGSLRSLKDSDSFDLSAFSSMT